MMSLYFTVIIFTLFVYTIIASAAVFKSGGDVIEKLIALIAIGLAISVFWIFTIPIAIAIGLGHLISLISKKK